MVRKVNFGKIRILHWMDTFSTGERAPLIIALNGPPFATFSLVSFCFHYYQEYITGRRESVELRYSTRNHTAYGSRPL